MIHSTFNLGIADLKVRGEEGNSSAEWNAAEVGWRRPRTLM